MPGEVSWGYGRAHNVPRRRLSVAMRSHGAHTHERDVLFGLKLRLGGRGTVSLRVPGLSLESSSDEQHRMRSTALRRVTAES